MTQVEFFLAYNECGDVTGDTDSSTARDRLTEDYGGECIHMHKIMINIPEQAEPAHLTVPAIPALVIA